MMTERLIKDDSSFIACAKVKEKKKGEGAYLLSNS